MFVETCLNASLTIQLQNAFLLEMHMNASSNSEALKRVFNSRSVRPVSILDACERV